jgi:hypothetical protein
MTATGAEVHNDGSAQGINIGAGCSVVQAGRVLDYQVLSLTLALGPLVDRRDAVVAPAALAYIWLVPMTWWLPAFRLKYQAQLSVVACLRSEARVSGLLVCTDTIPFLRRRLVSSLAAAGSSAVARLQQRVLVVLLFSLYSPP